MDIKKLEKDIEQQTRNGRDNIYVSVEDLAELGIYLEHCPDKRTFVSKKMMDKLIALYKEQHIEKERDDDFER